MKQCVDPVEAKLGLHRRGYLESSVTPQSEDMRSTRTTSLRLRPIPSPSFHGFKPASEASSRAKRANPARNTQPELLLRRALRKLGFRYRINGRSLAGKPDVVFREAKVVVFCDGDFWHGRYWAHLREELARRANADYWIPKIAANRARDRLCRHALRRAGWRVLRVWETDLKRNPDAIARRIVRIVESARCTPPTRARRRARPSAEPRPRRGSKPR